MPTTPGGTGEIGIRDLQTADADAVRALALAAAGDTAYAANMSAAIETAIAAYDPDARAAVAITGNQLIGLILYGSIAGAVGTGRVHLVITSPNHRRRGVATSLLQTSITRLAADGTRVIFVELPDDPALAPGKRLLLRAGFRVDATVPDYFRDGVDLTILRRELSAPD